MPNKQMIPVLKPKLVTFDRYVPYLKKIDEARWYSNAGQLLKDFQLRLSQLFSCDNDDLVILNSATSALTCLLYVNKIKNNYLTKTKYCLMPSWTFIATAAAAVNAGFTPYFVDVDLDSWAINPQDLLKKITNYEEIGSVIVTSPFGRPIDMKAWIEFSKTTKIPVIIDAAASFDSLLSCQEFFVNDTVPIVVSMHATKIFGIGEGGMVLFKNHEDNKLLSKVINFGFKFDRSISSFGINSKLSEYGAAVGLAMLDNWSEIRNQWQNTTLKQISNLERVGLKHDLSKSYFKSTCNIVVENVDIRIFAQKLLEKNISTRKWWNSGCSIEEPYKEFPKFELNNTSKLAESTLGIPFYIDQKDEEIEFVANAIKSLLI